MQRFKVGDRVAVLPRFVNLFPADSGTVMEVTPDPFRPHFNEYAVEFSDGSKANIFEFQLTAVNLPR
ncbi:MAG TPA: hypothetical protein VGK48_10490 [Terriglobia bacterium]|jgi:hypothetical protein